jgi:hypothetical protein
MSRGEPLKPVTAKAVLVAHNDMKWKAPGFEIGRDYANAKKQHRKALRLIESWTGKKPRDDKEKGEREVQIKKWTDEAAAMAAEMKRLEAEALRVEW